MSTSPTQAPATRPAGFRGEVIIRPSFAPRPEISHVVFDFDGTLSLIRQGWPEVMVPMFTEALPPIDGESQEDRRRLAFEDIMRLNGKQTIYQMMQLADRVRERGGSPAEPLWYKHEYLRRLDERIGDRVEGLATGRCAPDTYLVHGSIDLLDALTSRGLRLYLASGTDEPFVRREAEILGLTAMFAALFALSAWLFWRSAESQRALGTLGAFGGSPDT